MPQYVLRNLDPQLWSQFTERADREGWRTHALIVSLLGAYARGDVTPPQPPVRELPMFGWLRAHYRDVAREAGFSSLDTESQWGRLTQHVVDSDSGLEYQVLDSVPAERRLEILRWLGQTSDVPMAAGLTLRALMHVGDGSSRRAFFFEVLGLPPAQQASIHFDGGWRVLRVINGEQGKWSRPYLSKEEALNNLAEAIESKDAESA